jgi:hypothetical protein
MVGWRRSVFMQPGKRFKLKTSTVATEIRDGHSVSAALPAGCILEVISGRNDGDSRLEVLYEGRVFRMFAIDLNERGIEVY